MELLANPVEQRLKTPPLAIQCGELLVQLFNAAAQKLGTPLVAWSVFFVHVKGSPYPRDNAARRALVARLEALQSSYLKRPSHVLLLRANVLLEHAKDSWLRFCAFV